MLHNFGGLHLFNNVIFNDSIEILNFFKIDFLPSFL